MLRDSCCSCKWLASTTALEALMYIKLLLSGILCLVKTPKGGGGRVYLMLSSFWNLKSVIWSPFLSPLGLLFFCLVFLHFLSCHYSASGPFSFFFFFFLLQKFLQHFSLISNTSCLCFAFKSFLIYLSELLHLYTPSRQLRSSADTWEFRIPFFLFLLPDSSYLEPTPCFCPSFYPCRFFLIFLENLSLFENLFSLSFSPPVPLPWYVPLSFCVRVCACMCVRCMHWLLKTYVYLKNV